MSTLKNNLYIKIAVIIFLSIVLLIPAALIKGLIEERESTQTEAFSEISSKWGGAQTISGPILAIPFTKLMRIANTADSTTKVEQVKQYVYILPKKLNYDGRILPEIRNRGIYDVAVYNSSLTATGSFEPINFSTLDVDTSKLQFDKAEVILGIYDLRGIDKQLSLQWNNTTLQFNAGVPSDDVVSSGVSAPVTIEKNDTAGYSFSFTLSLKGSQYMQFTPLGKTTDVAIQSPWPNPSFSGSFLPDSKTVTDTSFSANWNILHLNRKYPQTWVGNKYTIEESAFGLNLLLPVDNYQKVLRCVKYAILFIAFTFLVFFFIEVLNKTFIHPVQYLLVGLSLLIFFTLLLSLSEHTNFNAAYIIAALATLTLIGGYVKAILHVKNLWLFVVGLLSILYTFIFVIMQLQDYALLIGSIGLFIILAVCMYFSRRIDWYSLSMEETSTEQR